MVADIIIIAVFALLFFIDFKRGIAITILNVAGLALTGFLAYHISNFLASWVYTAFVQQTLTTNLQQMINKLLGGVLGLAEAAILVFFAVNIFSGVLEFSNPEMLNNPMISGAVFKFFSVAV